MFYENFNEEFRHYIGQADAPLQLRPTDPKLPFDDRDSRTCSRIDQSYNTLPRVVIGVLAKEIGLSDDAITSKGILNYAASVAQEKCPSPAGIADILIFVHHGDPTTFTDDKFTGLERFGRTVNLEHDGKPYG